MDMVLQFLNLLYPNTPEIPWFVTWIMVVAIQLMYLVCYMDDDKFIMHSLSFYVFLLMPTFFHALDDGSTRFLSLTAFFDSSLYLIFVFALHTVMSGTYLALHLNRKHKIKKQIKSPPESHKPKTSIFR